MSVEEAQNLEIPDIWSGCRITGLDWETSVSNWQNYRVGSVASLGLVTLRGGPATDYVGFKKCLERLSKIPGVQIIFT